MMASMVGGSPYRVLAERPRAAEAVVAPAAPAPIAIATTDPEVDDLAPVIVVTRTDRAPAVREGRGPRWAIYGLIIVGMILAFVVGFCPIAATTTGGR
jgi:hypothetical protein